MRAKVYATTTKGATITLYPSPSMAEKTADKLRNEGYINVSIEYPDEKGSYEDSTNK